MKSIFLILLMTTTGCSICKAQTTIDPDLLLIGADELPSGTGISDTFFVYNAKNGGLLGGQFSGATLDATSVGRASVSLGYTNIASGFAAVAMGYKNIASGISGPTALGYETEASGSFGATSLGIGTLASGLQGSTALGHVTAASGSFGATAMGNGTLASGDNGAIALGAQTEASGNAGATAIGNKSVASGFFAPIALGNETQARGSFGSTAIGHMTISNGNSCTVVGLYNDTLVSKRQVVSSMSPVFIIGNGDFGVGNESNAMVVRKNGHAEFMNKVGIGTSIINSGAELHVKTDVNGSIHIEGTSGNQTLRFYESGSNKGTFGWSTSEQLVYLFAGGNIFRGKDGKLGIAGRTPTTNELEVAGSASKTTAGSWLANSDRRIKTDISEIEDGISFIQKLRPVKFKYTEEWKASHPSIKDHYYYNYIAQDYKEVFPESVQGSGEYLESSQEEILQIDTYNAQIINIAATQELINDHEILKNEVADLRDANAIYQSEIVSLKHEMEQLKAALDRIIN